jgi:hypothetical protein
MGVTLLTFDASLWGAFAFGAFLATLGYCTAYVMNFQKFSVGNVDVSSGSVRVRRWLLIVTALASLALFTFSFSVFVGLQVMPRGPDLTQVEPHYFTDVQHKDAAALTTQPVVAAMVRVLSYDGFSHARVFVNNQRIFDSSVHCRFSHQCKAKGASKPPINVACVPWICTTYGSQSGEKRHLPVVFQGTVPASAVSHDPNCKLVKTMADVRNCEPCGDRPECKDWRMVNWQTGIETLDHDLPFERNLIEMKVLRPGENIVEVTAQNSGVGRCAFRVELVLRTADGQLHPHPFEISGPVKTRRDVPGPRYGVEESREPFTTCDRQRMKLALFNGNTPP